MLDNRNRTSQYRPKSEDTGEYWPTLPPHITAPEPFWRDFLPADFNLPRSLLSMLTLAGILRLSDLSSEQRPITVPVACTVALSLPDRPDLDDVDAEEDHA